MNSTIKSNIFEESLQPIRRKYATHLQGGLSPFVVVCSSRPLSEKAAAAIKASFESFGYKEDWAAYVSVASEEGNILSSEDLFTIVEALDPKCVLVTDVSAAKVLSLGYKASIKVNDVCDVLGLEVFVLEDFGKALESSADKQKAWAILKKMPRA